MKKKSNIITKKKKKKKIQVSSGFTLIELLAAIAILSIIVSVVIYFAMGIVGNAREKSYQVTINNVETQAGNYVLEDFTSMIWVNGVDTSYQYQCITVQDLIDAGYFKGDVLESKVDADRTVLATDYVYIERDSDNKTVTKNVLLVGRNASYAGLCSNISAVGRINFEYDGDMWVRDKKLVTINYRLYNYDRVNNYIYDYVFENEHGVVVNDFAEEEFTGQTKRMDVEILENGDLCAKIKKKDDGTDIASSCYSVAGIDKELPDGEIKSLNNVSEKQTVTLTMIDSISGVDMYYFGKSNPETTSVEWIDVEDAKSIETNVMVDSEGKYYLGIRDVAGNEKVIDTSFYKTILSINNGTVTPNVIITQYGDSFRIPTGNANPYYTFNGWYTYISYSGSPIIDYTPVESIDYTNTLYGKTTENRLTGGVVTISGTNTYGETLTAEITRNTTPKADNYTYQWYMNDSNSNTGGTAIRGATSETLDINKEQVGKYIYVVVTATKSNYRSTTFNDITDTNIGKRSITVLADSNSKVYDGAALTDSGCVINSGSLAFNDSISCKMTSASTITNVGEKVNEISEVSVWNEDNSTANNDGYNITTESGMLKVTRKQVGIPSCNIGLVYNGTLQTLISDSNTGYSLENNSVTNAGDYTVIAKLDSNYEWVDGTTNNKTFTCSIEKAIPKMTVDPEKLSLVYPEAGNVLYTYDGDGELTCSSSSNNIATCNVDTSSKKVVVTPLKNGDITMTLSASEGKNYKAISKEVHVGSSATYTVRYAANGCGVAPGNQNTVHDSATVIKAMTSINSGMSFISWNTNINGNGTEYKVGDSFSSADNKNVTLFAQCKTYKVNINYAIEDGTLKTTTTSSGTVYNWSQSYGLIHRNGVLFTTLVDYGSSTGSYGLADYNNSTNLYITKTGYTTLADSEWVCLSENCIGKIYSQTKVYQHSDFCDASEGDCTVVLGVNWKDLTAPTITFGTNSSNGKWIKTAKSIITVTDAGSGIDPATLKYVFSTENSSIPNTKFSNGDEVSLAKANGVYYLIAYACDNAGNCTTKKSGEFKLDNIPPTITCNKSEAFFYQDILDDNFSDSYVISPDRIQDEVVYLDLKNDINYAYISDDKYDVTQYDYYDEDCTVFAELYFRSGTSYISNFVFDYTDDSGTAKSAGISSRTFYDEDGNSNEVEPNGTSCIFKGTRCNCLNGYCSIKVRGQAVDEAGNYSDYKDFYYYWGYNNSTPATPADQKLYDYFEWTWDRLRSAYCKYDSATGKYTTVPSLYSCVAK